MIIHILGAAGSGTTTLGKALAKAKGYTFLDTDDFHWQKTHIPFTVARPKEERVQMLKDAISKCDNCVISGAMCKWGDELIPYFDLVIKLETPTEIRIERLKDREFRRFGNRILEGGDMYFNHLRFIEWAKVYDHGGLDVRSNLLHNNWLKKINKKTLILDGTKEVSELIDIIDKELFN